MTVFEGRFDCDIQSPFSRVAASFGFNLICPIIMDHQFLYYEGKKLRRERESRLRFFTSGENRLGQPGAPKVSFCPCTKETVLSEDVTKE